MSDLAYSRGALVYLPAGARLYQFAGEERAPSRYTDIIKPTNVLLIEKDRPYCKVIYGGERWKVYTKDVYPMRAEGKSE